MLNGVRYICSLSKEINKHRVESCDLSQRPTIGRIHLYDVHKYIGQSVSKHDTDQMNHGHCEYCIQNTHVVYKFA